MKLKLILETTTKKNKPVQLKLNVKPSKHIGFINFINLALQQENPVTISFEKISKSGQKEQSKIFGEFKFQGKGQENLSSLEAEIQENERKKRKKK